MVTTEVSVVSAKCPCRHSSQVSCLAMHTMVILHLAEQQRPFFRLCQSTMSSRLGTWVGWLGTVLVMMGDCATIVRLGACRLAPSPPVMSANE